MTSETEERIRILYCQDCRTVEELPNFQGDPAHDTILAIAVSRHETPSGQRHIGKLFDVDPLVWFREDVRRQIIDQIKGGSKGLAEIDPDFYNTRSTFFEDAMKCYTLHLRPKGACPDWMSDAKILLPDTKAARKEEGLAAPAKAPGPKIHLCDFCVAKRYYAKKANEERGIQ